MWGEDKEWFWTPANAFGLAPSLRLGTTTLVTGLFVPCEKDGIRRLVASICRWGDDRHIR